MMRTLRLGQICSLLPARSVVTAGDAKVRIATSACLSVFGFNAAAIKSARMRSADVADATMTAGEILLARSNTPELVGNVSLFQCEDKNVVSGDLLIRLWPDRKLADGFYLTGFLSHLFHQGFWRERAGGASGTMKKITRTQCNALEIPLPPLPEQRRIAARLREQLAEVERARAALQSQLDAAEGLGDAQLRSIFDGRLTSKWRRVRLGDVCHIQLGKMLSPKSKTGVGSLPYLRNANVQWGRVDVSNVAQMDFDEKDEAKFLLKSGDLLVCEGGEPGRAAIWHGEIARCCYQKALHRLRPIDGAIDSVFLMHRLRFAALRHEFTDSNAKTTIAHLPLVRLAQYEMALPPILEQQRITATLDAMQEPTQRVVTDIKQRLAAVEKLPAALLREAFSKVT